MDDEKVVTTEIIVSTARNKGSQARKDPVTKVVITRKAAEATYDELDYNASDSIMEMGDQGPSDVERHSAPVPSDLDYLYEI